MNKPVYQASNKLYDPKLSTEAQNTSSICKEILHDLTVSWNLTIAYPSHLVLKRMPTFYSTFPKFYPSICTDYPKNITQPLMMNSIFC